MRRKFGFNKKVRKKLLIVYVYFQPNSCNTHTEYEWAQGTLLRQWRKVPPAHPQRVHLQITIDYDFGWHVSHQVFSAEVPEIRPIVSET
jgi:hypothetical protein